VNSEREHENPEDEDPVKIIDDIVDLYGDIQANLSAGAAIAGEEREIPRYARALGRPHDDGTGGS